MALRTILAVLALLFCACFGLHAEGPDSSQMQTAQTSKIEMTQQQCKVKCQRFGMKRMGEAFQGITSPTVCVDKCKEVYPEK
mmetsp:Transcript_38900/g.70153  ORF Transcript_38900/g.70153 Transcript_38900/m.70153 type:complete len:82 (+) Transcript_38900:88-333(+)|eukprot:CAMPEP_0197642350 /NCGR_PEP_ID=MMETSP1338-20131121/16037_1 /TAXON_ID=43686 ORGANISM="Pelagodinium beii, Strain RCC1491" /NCGR_SAMPLE_ID=MMETSP1338 /ASSEMBLY_ACC=CAM_ASM_000754 /LENGTH=81 /DNA_ID=CAMNT_0043215459 /DNA_START=102 /DNA_END=347 /DNA_ORIENTATION=+